MPLYEVVLTSVYQNQQCINRFNYLMSGVPASVSGSFALASAFGAIYDPLGVPPGYPPATLFRAIREVSNTGVLFEQLTVLDPYDDVDFYQVPFIQAAPGLIAGSLASPALALGYRTNLIRRDVARGTKRFVGIVEEGMGTGGVIEGNLLAAANTLATKLADNLVYDDEGNTLTFAPCIAGKQRYDPETGLPDPNGSAYRYYPVEADQLNKLAVGIDWQMYTQVRTQTSRQYGRGR